MDTTNMPAWTGGALIAGCALIVALSLSSGQMDEEAAISSLGALGVLGFAMLMIRWRYIAQVLRQKVNAQSGTRNYKAAIIREDTRDPVCALTVRMDDPLKRVVRWTVNDQVLSADPTFANPDDVLFLRRTDTEHTYKGLLDEGVLDEVDDAFNLPAQGIKAVYVICTARGQTIGRVVLYSNELVIKPRDDG